jgi:hypothetical protein
MLPVSVALYSTLYYRTRESEWLMLPVVFKTENWYLFYTEQGKNRGKIGWEQHLDHGVALEIYARTK